MQATLICIQYWDSTSTKWMNYSDGLITSDKRIVTDSLWLFPIPRCEGLTVMTGLIWLSYENEIVCYNRPDRFYPAVTAINDVWKSKLFIGWEHGHGQLRRTTFAIWIFIQISDTILHIQTIHRYIFIINCSRVSMIKIMIVIMMTMLMMIIIIIAKA